MVRESTNLIAALVGVLLLFAGAYLFNKYYAPETATEKSAQDPQSSQPVVSTPTSHIKSDSYTIGLPLFYEWLEPPVTIHALKKIDPATLRKIRNGQSLVESILVQSPKLQRDLSQLKEAVDYICREVGPSTLKRKNGAYLLHLTSIKEQALPLGFYPKPNNDVSPTLAQDFEGIIRRFHPDNNQSIKDSYRFKRTTWLRKIENSSFANSCQAANMQYMNTVGRFAEGLAYIEGLHNKLTQKLEQLSEAHQAWPTFKGEMTPIIAKNIQGQAKESAIVAAGGSVTFQREYDSKTTFVCEFAARGNRLFLLAGTQANPTMGIEWTATK